MNNMIMMSSKRADRSWRRPSAFFTIGEGSEADEDSDQYNEFDSDDEISGKPKRKTSNAIVYSSNSSLESDTELGLELLVRRKDRRVSVAPMHAGLQTWVDTKGLEVAAGQTSVAPGGVNLQLPPVMQQRRKLAYDDVKELLNNGKLKEAKNAVRDSDWDLTDEIRSRLWPLLDSIHEANRTSTNLDGFYWETVTQLYGSDELPEKNSAIPGFVEQRLYYQLSAEGKSICDRVVSVVGYAYPEITYCPLLLPVASLFLHYVEEEKTYNCICTLLSSRQKVFLTQTKLQWEVTNVTAMQLTKKFSKSAFNFVVRQVKPGERIEQLFQGWIWWIFRDLPLPHLGRIMDCFLVEGVKVLYRVAIAILLNFSKAASSDSTWSSQLENSGLESTISKYCRSLPMTPQRLLKTAFSIRAFRGSEIRKTSTKVELLLKSKATGKEGKLQRSKSTENMPTSQSQHDIQMMSHTLAIKELLMIWQWLPVRITMYQPVMLYTTEEHGCSLTTFFNRVENHEPTILTIKTTNNEVFGAYCSSAWALRNSKDERGERQRYFGTGETFLFSLRPEVVKYPWVGIQPRKDDENEDDTSNSNNKLLHSAELFMHADTHMISIGGGKGQGLVLDADLRFGKTENCQTFENPPLVESKDFEVCVIEVIGFSGM